MKKREKKKKRRHSCVCCGTINAFPYSDCFLCCICETITDLSLTPMHASHFSASIDKNSIPGTEGFILALVNAHAKGDLEEGRSLIFSGFSSPFVLAKAFSRETPSNGNHSSIIIDEKSFNNFYHQLGKLKCSFFTQTLMASLDHLVRRPGALLVEHEINPARWIILALLTPFLSRKRSSMEGTFHHSLARRLFSLLRQASSPTTEMLSKTARPKSQLSSMLGYHGDKKSEEGSILPSTSAVFILNTILDALPLSFLRRLAELANWTLNVRIGRISGITCYSAKAKAKVIASDWVILGGAYMLQMISESNGRVHRMEPSELYSMAIDLIPMEVILADWHQTTSSVSLTNLLVWQHRFSLPNGKRQLLVRHPGIVSLGIKSRLIESELIPNGYLSGCYIPLVVRVPRSPTSQMLQASIIQLFNANPLQLRGRIKIEFQGEPGIDAGGLLREWLQLLMHVLMDPNLGLFSSGDWRF